MITLHLSSILTFWSRDILARSSLFVLLHCNIEGDGVFLLPYHPGVILKFAVLVMFLHFCPGLSSCFSIMMAGVALVLAKSSWFSLKLLSTIMALFSIIMMFFLPPLSKSTSDCSSSSHSRGVSVRAGAVPVHSQYSKFFNVSWSPYILFWPDLATDVKWLVFTPNDTQIGLKNVKQFVFSIFWKCYIQCKVLHILTN